ncbi:FG-GAP repeat protein [Streptomyces sp. NPDC058739]|uniref:FG-GAP repeat protein n=1 Tax=Streptomyces sp. NPDC058739 TaxID=3346618 RepID=UPI00369C54BB
MRTLRTRSAAVAAAAFLLAAGAAVATAPAAYAGTPGGTRADDRNTDFNGDGYDDVLVGAPDATVSGRHRAGAATVQYGGPRGMGTRNARVFSQNSAGVPGAAETGDGFGRAVATGDLDGDGYDDAVIGLPGEDLTGAADAGGVVVFFGTPRGLTGSASLWLQDDTPRSGARFGSALAAARFTDTTPGDLLAVLDRVGPSVYRFETASRAAGGGAHRRAELTSRHRLTAPSGTSRAAAPGISPRSLTTGDYDRNGFADLVVSGTSTGAEPGYGWSYVLPGTAADADPLPVLALRGGPVVASGDVDGDGYDDLVTGEPHSPDDGGESMTGGMVGYYRGGPDGPAGREGPGTPPVWWTQDSAGVPGTSERGDGFGADLSVGDTDRDGHADVAIGVPEENVGTVADAGQVVVLRGSARGMTASRAWSVTQNTARVPGAVEKGDRFGGQVAFTDPNDDGRFGLLAAAPGKNTADGAVWVFSAGSAGLTTSGSWTYGLGTFGVSGLNARYGAVIDD